MAISANFNNPVVDKTLADIDKQMGLIDGWASSAISNANNAISALGGFTAPPLPPAPVAPNASTAPSISASVSDRAFALDGARINWQRPAPITTGVASVDAITEGLTEPLWDDYVDGLPAFSAPTGSVTVDSSGMPTDVPTLLPVTFPDELGAMAYPEMDALDTIVIPTFDFTSLQLDSFDGTAPSFSANEPSTLAQWNEPLYFSDNLDDVKTVVKRMLAGGTGIAPSVEQALYDRAYVREDLTTHRAVQASFDAFASRGFAMPDGVLAEQVNAAIQDGALRVSALSRDILIEAAKWEIENLRFAVQQGVALENLLINLFNNVAQRAFEIAKLKVESDLQMYRVQVDVYNAKMAGYQTEANVWRTALEGEKIKVEVFQSELQAQKLVGEINQIRLQKFITEWEAVKTAVEVYKARMSAAQVQGEVNKTLIESYKARVDAYAAKMGAEKTKVDAYSAQWQAESAKAGVWQAMASAFGASANAYGSTIEGRAKAYQMAIAEMQADTQRFVAEVEAEKAQIGAQQAELGLSIEAAKAKSTLGVAEMQAKGEVARMNIAVAELNSTQHMHKYAADAKMWEAMANAIVQEANINQESLSAAARAASTLAAGAMSAIHVSAGESASGVGTTVQTFTSSA